MSEGSRARMHRDGVGEAETGVAGGAGIAEFIVSVVIVSRGAWSGRKELRKSVQGVECRSFDFSQLESIRGGPISLG